MVQSFFKLLRLIDWSAIIDFIQCENWVFKSTSSIIISCLFRLLTPIFSFISEFITTLVFSFNTLQVIYSDIALSSIWFFLVKKMQLNVLCFCTVRKNKCNSLDVFSWLKRNDFLVTMGHCYCEGLFVDIDWCDVRKTKCILQYNVQK